jgi:hypothetical protein
MQDSANITAGLKTLESEIMSQASANTELKTFGEQLMSQVMAGVYNNTNLVSGVEQLLSTFSTDLTNLGANITSGADAQTAAQTFAQQLKTDIVSDVTSNTKLMTGLEQLKASLAPVIANSTGLFSGLQTLSNQVSADITQFSTVLPQTNNGSSIINSVGQAVGEFSTAFGAIAAGNTTDIQGTLSQAAQKAAMDVTSNPAFPQVESDVKTRLDTISDELASDFNSLNTNSNTTKPLGADRFMITFVMMFAVLFALLL